MNEDSIDDINEELENVIDEGREILNKAEFQEKFDELKTEAELLIRKHPLKSVLIGAAAGLLFAKLFRSN